jgi:hypothetical protein
MSRALWAGHPAAAGVTLAGRVTRSGFLSAVTVFYDPDHPNDEMRSQRIRWARPRVSLTEVDWRPTFLLPGPIALLLAAAVRRVIRRSARGVVRIKVLRPRRSHGCHWLPGYLCARCRGSDPRVRRR